jgi:hypothetical protein
MHYLRAAFNIPLDHLVAHPANCSDSSPSEIQLNRYARRLISPGVRRYQLDVSKMGEAIIPEPRGRCRR